MARQVLFSPSMQKKNDKNQKKLRLDKQTVRRMNLSDEQLRLAAGGRLTDDPSNASNTSVVSFGP